ncbi:MAG TPA: TIGR03084 family metal-binding protein [Acidimicrobiales bacterium]|nr:TIGR03084 family metal-binding protein [Acidimicrobiales bacterium]
MAPDPTTLPGLLEDLEVEHADLEALVGPLDEASWDLATPARGWAVRDQVSHLAFFDDAATAAIVDPAAFTVTAEAALAAGGDPMEEHLRRGRAMAGREVLAWWQGARAHMVGAARTLDAHDRVPWFGPPMGALSFVSARLMETWAHGQDVADALGVARVPTARLRHIAHLGVRARRFSYVVRGLEVPDDPVRVELTGPSGEHWEWDTDAASGLVQGPALDFCLVVTQRRNVADTALTVQGTAASEWLAIAQAFAGPPGPGRPPHGAG